MDGTEREHHKVIISLSMVVLDLKNNLYFAQIDLRSYKCLSSWILPL